MLTTWRTLINGQYRQAANCLKLKLEGSSCFGKTFGLVGLVLDHCHLVAGFRYA